MLHPITSLPAEGRSLGRGSCNADPVAHRLGDRGMAGAAIVQPEGGLGETPGQGEGCPAPTRGSRGAQGGQGLPLAPRGSGQRLRPPG